MCDGAAIDSMLHHQETSPPCFAYCFAWHSCPWDPTDNIWNAMDTNHHGDHGVQTVKHIVDQGWVPMCDLQQQCMIKLMRMKGSCDSCTYYVPHDTDKLG